MKILLITGSSSGVGKTRLAMKLMEIVPHAVYMKLGHGKKKKGGRPKNYFEGEQEALEFIAKEEGKCEYLLVESNRLVGKIDPDPVIFLDWKSSIGKLELSSAQKAKMLEVLTEQHEYLSRSRLSFRTKVWLRRDGRIVIGEGLARLLHGIRSHGSLSRAVSGEGISYCHAWGILRIRRKGSVSNF
ncbi:MAG: hypothetical protein ABIC40_04030 [bacterium]